MYNPSKTLEKMKVLDLVFLEKTPITPWGNLGETLSV
jgi:hypothetical protein